MALNIKNLRIVSSAFTPLEPIPQRYTSDGENISPPLEWSGLPSGTQQLALICYDPDAPLPDGFTLKDLKTLTLRCIHHQKV
jgi:hypothetical protein